MERILRSKEMAEIILLPVRHHSPACAFHVERTIEEIRPAVILVEGPDNADALIPVMVHEETKAPFAIYYSYHDQSGRISEEKAHYKCYYPFLDYSPELAALRAGNRLGIETAFIDLPYGDILAASREDRGLRRAEEEKSNYNDDYLLSRNAYLLKLCERTGLRSFDEFWEKYFELNGMQEKSERWFDNLSVYCGLARENTPRESMEDDGCLARESYMAKRIREHARRLAGAESTVLVVTGGFHTPGLKALLTGEEECAVLEAVLGERLKRAEEIIADAERGPETARTEGRHIGTDLGTEANGDEGSPVSREKKTEAGKTRDKVPDKDQGVYLMPYSMEAADALNGYASGMPFTGFYQKIWERARESETPYESAVLDMIVAAGKETRRKEGYLSTYDEICACSMAGGLAALRGKREPGAYELLDAVLSSFVKGEYNLASDTPVRILRKLMTGKEVGALCPQADVPPIIHDFQDECKRFGLKIVSTLEAEATLSIFSNKKHRQQSMFFNRMQYLNTAFARKIKGPNLQLKKDRNLMREIWKYKWNVQVNAALIEVSVYGATIEEAVVSLVKEELKKELGAKESALLLTRVFEMGLRDQMQPVFARAHQLMLADTDFYSIAEALKSLMMMEELGKLYGSALEFGELIAIGCRKLTGLLPSMTRIKDEDLESCMNALKLLYRITGREGMRGQEREDYIEALQKMTLDGEINAGLNGCVHGILYGSGQETAEEIETVCKGYLKGTEEQLFSTAQFFRGLFFTARDLVFIGEQFVRMLDGFYGTVSQEEFMELLPKLRMAFAYFTPREIDRIAAMAAGIHGKGSGDIMERQEVYPDWYAYGKELDGYVKAQLI
ncbi:MAG: hypothetical protein HFH93_08910 [Lachnospiraceae bacterium]|nr:hypothetical protein [Lachnospiraceae bacterium]